MRRLAGLAVIMLLAPCCAGANSSDDTSADALFQAGYFTEARARYATIVGTQPNDYHATVQLGRIALLSNQYADAEMWLQKAGALQPNETDARVTLAETYYRQDEFAKAVAVLQGIDVAANQLAQQQYPTLNVAKLQSFAGQIPYEVQDRATTNRVKLLQTDPIPLVSLRINGEREVTFFIDTGGSEVALDSEFAKEIGVPDYGSVTGTFSGGQQSTVSHTRIDALTLGGWTIHNVPAVALPLRALSDIGPPGTVINGLIGTTLFYHFLTTLDLPHDELVLRKKGKAYVSKNTTAVPFWFAGDHFMVGEGQINDQPPSLLFVDTGLVGAGVKLGESMLKKANIQLDYAHAQTGAGAGGILQIVPYSVDRASLGSVAERNVAGLYDGPFPWENLFGFYLAGMLGHEFFRSYAMIFDFDNMQLLLVK